MSQRDSRSQDARDSANQTDAASVVPGKQSGADRIVQRSGPSTAPSDPAIVQPAAERGASGSGGGVPFRDQMESGFGTSFSDVRVHSGDQAASASRSIGAEAYTMGSDIVLGTAPTPSLIAHELAHVVQQRSGAGPSSGVGAAGDSFETEAHGAADVVASGGQSDLASKYPVGDMGGVVQRKAVQRYESGEHAMMGCGPGYPGVGGGDLTLPNGATIYMGEMVAFGDFYADMNQLREAPRQEVETLAGLCRIEAIWFQARRAHATAAGNTVTTQIAQGAPGGTAVPGSTAGGNAAGPAASTPHAPSAANLQNVAPHVLDNDPVWNDTAYAINGQTLRAVRSAIYAQFAPSWSFFGINIPETTQPETGMGMVRATLGRRRFRGENNSLPGPHDPNAPNSAQDPARLGGDYLDLAQNNLAHFTTDNWANWSAMHTEACNAHARATTEQDRSMAIATDMMGGHFLTDRFSSGHFVDKEELMAYATRMMVGQATSHGRAGANDNETLHNELQAAIRTCFEDGNVVAQWDAGVDEAVSEGVISAREATLLHGVTMAGNFVPDSLVDVIMGMPWRHYDASAAPADTGDARSYGPNSVAPGAASAGGGDYHLGVGNLAALQVHDALNSIGFTVLNGAGNQWRIQGDNHLNPETQTISAQALAESQAQVRAGHAGPSELDNVRRYLPTTALMDPAWIGDFFGGEWAGAQFDAAKISQLQGYVAGRQIPIATDGGHGAVSPEMTSVCHQVMEILFLQPSGATATQSDNNTGLNLSMLKTFLIRRLHEMVPMAYLATSASDLPAAALELYAPRSTNPDGSRTVLPRAANDFQWAGDNLTFALNVTECPAQSYTLKAKVYNQDAGFDMDEHGQMYGRGNADPSGGTVSGMLGAAGGATNYDGTMGGALRDDDTMFTSFTFTVNVGAAPPAAPGASPAITVPATITVPRQGFPYSSGDRYVTISGDPAGDCVIGRSNTASETSPGNPTPAGGMPRVTGADRTAPPQTITPTAISGGAIGWSENTCLFAIDVTPAPTADAAVPLYIKTMDWDIVGSDAQIGGIRTVNADVLSGTTTSRIVNFTPAEDNWNDTYIVIYSDAAASHEIGRSRTQGHNKGGAIPNQAGRKPATTVAGFRWNGDVLTFTVQPTDSDPVYVKFYDKDLGYDYDASGHAISGPSDTDEQLGGVREVRINNGVGNASSDGDSDAYGIVFSDAGCTTPLGRSGTHG